MTAIQDKLVGNHCYGCGADNPKGMQIKSHWDGKESVCVYEPRPEQCAGPEQYLYGGTIASLIDCHSIGTALANYYRLEGREVGEGEEIWCVTGRLSVDYLAPTPIDLLPKWDGVGAPPEPTLMEKLNKWMNPYGTGKGDGK